MLVIPSEAEGSRIQKEFSHLTLLSLPSERRNKQNTLQIDPIYLPVAPIVEEKHRLIGIEHEVLSIIALVDIVRINHTRLLSRLHIDFPKGVRRENRLAEIVIGKHAPRRYRSRKGIVHKAAVL